MNISLLVSLLLLDHELCQLRKEVLLEIFVDVLLGSRSSLDWLLESLILGDAGLILLDLLLEKLKVSLLVQTVDYVLDGGLLLNLLFEVFLKGSDLLLDFLQLLCLLAIDNELRGPG